VHVIDTVVSDFLSVLDSIKNLKAATISATYIQPVYFFTRFCEAEELGFEEFQSL